MTNWRKWRDNKWYPEISMDEDGSWSCQVWNGSVWVELQPDDRRRAISTPPQDSPELALAVAWSTLNEMEEK